MIVVIDDRVARMQRYLGNRTEANYPMVRLLTDDQDIASFDAFLHTQGAAPQILDGARIICVHATGFFNDTSGARSFFERWCRQQHKALISFSGGNAGVNTLEPGVVYASDAETVYRRIAWLLDTGLTEKLSPDVFLMGEHFLRNQLLLLRRGLFLFQNQGSLQAILDEQPMYTHPLIRQVFNEWEALPEAATLEDWLTIINRQIK